MLYENMTFENIMDRCLSRVAASIDKREGSVVYDAIAPAAAELAIMYIELAYLLDRAFPDTEEGDDLTLKCQERSVLPNSRPRPRSGRATSRTGAAGRWTSRSVPAIPATP